MEPVKIKMNFADENFATAYMLPVCECGQVLRNLKMTNNEVHYQCPHCNKLVKTLIGPFLDENTKDLDFSEMY